LQADFGKFNGYSLFEGTGMSGSSEKEEEEEEEDLAER
jgi:hypothetical protein